ncbi:glmZ(sRNA)-inactivating NTPase [uncultured Ruminococcus sp.]|uniref:RNase adapter RapZ n=1 Tax=Massiliimalia timonensis TaxID=1987501 RepID=A0A8J6PHS7_9FIRM|nr:RNase adapter RapZ [Massiliimalia timonensis]MBC8610280.1 RNase adapter RapZ [Massiliimalia timonensis]SCH00677.1 glmZ(sRNA)-inactivating NTPase [uncultured Ruminococcus sp.]SCH71397.1 glmZ(sRNA)-inactivating NTPase [uncultured Clostridium sp.]
MEMLIITGMSGAGKSRMIDTLEDIGFYCVDNMPPMLISKFAELASQSENNINKMAVVVDARSGRLFQEFYREMDLLVERGIEHKLLFLDCSNDVLMRRYKETRRKHPLFDEGTPSIEQAIQKEREMLRPARERADYVIDTTHLAPIQLKEKVTAIFLDNISTGMLINCMSFGFKYGPASEADLVFDVRCLPNPFYIKELKFKTGITSEVQEYVMSWPQSQELLKKLIDLIDFLIPLYVAEGKSQLVIAMGCTGGKHRSVTFAEMVYRHLLDQNRKVTVNHRDISK